MEHDVLATLSLRYIIATESDLELHRIPLECSLECPAHACVENIKNESTDSHSSLTYNYWIIMLRLTENRPNHAVVHSIFSIWFRIDVLECDLIPWSTQFVLNSQSILQLIKIAIIQSAVSFSPLFGAMCVHLTRICLRTTHQVFREVADVHPEPNTPGTKWNVE